MNRPTSTALAALSLLSATAPTACGGSSAPATDEPKAGSSPSAATAKAPAPSEHLAATIVTKADTRLRGGGAGRRVRLRQVDGRGDGRHS
ncbi:hypothetical protein [Streptomyces sp. IBSBF 2394]|uniref:hypothetical protein n=1 Tax=Streptomyces sp. IBSBF 2394 TaxID=2903532 RepID=UPI002FDC6E99